MSSQQNVDIVKRGYEAFGRGDIDGLISLLDDSIEWISPGPADLPTAGTRHGAAEVRQFFGLVTDLFEFKRFEPTTFVAEGDLVVVLGEDSLVFKPSGTPIDESWAHVFTVRSGKIVKFQEYIDTAALVAALRTTQARA